MTDSLTQVVNNGGSDGFTFRPGNGAPCTAATTEGALFSAAPGQKVRLMWVSIVKDSQTKFSFFRPVGLPLHFNGSSFQPARNHAGTTLPGRKLQILADVNNPKVMPTVAIRGSGGRFATSTFIVSEMDFGVNPTTCKGAGNNELCWGDMTVPANIKAAAGDIVNFVWGWEFNGGGEYSISSDHLHPGTTEADSKGILSFQQSSTAPASE
jgi:hypothetical protein